VNDTVTITYSKAPGKPRVKFVDTKVALGGTAKGIVNDATIYNAPITYTYNGEATSPYVTKSGSDLIAGSQNAIIKITADIPETENYLAYNGSITLIVGDSAQAVNKDEYYNQLIVDEVVKTNPKLPLHAAIVNSQLSVGSQEAGDINVSVFSVTGQKVLEKKLGSSNASVSLAHVPNGSYLVMITQGIKQLNVRWNKTK
jgi:endoglucanase